MNILFLSLSFSTAEHTSFYEDLLNEFHKNGHNVYVACANEKRSKEKDGLELINGLSVLRIRTGNITGNISLIEKGISTLTIDYYFLRGINKEFGNIKFDLILYPTPPITLINTIESIKKRTGAKTYLLLKDIFPQNAVDLGMMSKEGLKKIIYNYFRYKEKKLYEISDFIGCMSPANCNYIIKHNSNIKVEKVEVCPNSTRVEEKEVPENTKDITLRKKYNIPKDAVIFIYGGNLGRPQGIPFLIKCIDKVKSKPNVFFLIIGKGTEYERVKKYIEEEKPQNVILIKYLPKEEYQIIVKQCDVGMIFLDYRFTIPNFPSRLLSYLRAAMPVLLATDKSTDIGQIAEINGFGMWCKSNDTDEFENIVNKFIIADRHEMGKKGWTFLKENYTTEQSYKIIINHFNDQLH